MSNKYLLEKAKAPSSSKIYTLSPKIYTFFRNQTKRISSCQDMKSINWIKAFGRRLVSEFSYLQLEHWGDYTYNIHWLRWSRTLLSQELHVRVRNSIFESRTPCSNQESEFHVKKKLQIKKSLCVNDIVMANKSGTKENSCQTHILYLVQ